jgi:hypothetical protein
VTLALIVYLIGVGAGILLGDATPGARLAYALLWPIGIAAFVVTLAILFAASLIAFPMFAVTLLAASVIYWTLS